MSVRATAVPVIKKKTAKKSLLAITLPNGLQFNTLTRVKTVANAAATLTWDFTHKSLDPDVIIIELTGKVTLASKPTAYKPKAGSIVTVGPPGPGDLIITLENPPPTVLPVVEITPVVFVEDIS